MENFYKKLGPLQKRILVLLIGGISLGLAYSPRQRYKVLRQMSREFEKISNDSLRRAIRSLYENKMIDLKEKEDSIQIVLLENGKKRILEYQLEKIEIKKPSSWDKKWRLVVFDIPKDLKKIRESIRLHLKRLGFYQYQKSIFIHPYECKNEIDFLIEFYSIRKYVRYIIAINLDNELHLKEIFKSKIKKI